MKMPYECKVEEKPTQPTLSIRTIISVQEMPQVLGKSYMSIGKYLEELGEPFAGPPFAMFYNMDMQNLDVEIGFPVAKKLPKKGEIKASEIPGGKKATLLYKGAFSEMEPAYNKLSKWVEENGYKSTGVAIEYYLDDPKDTPTEELRTQIVYLLK